MSLAPEANVWNALGLAARMTWRQQARAKKTWVVLCLIAFGCVISATNAHRFDPLRITPVEAGSPVTQEMIENAASSFTSRVVILLYFKLMLPLLTLVYAVAAMADDIQSRSLLYVIIRPIRRWQLYLARFLGVLPLTLLTALAGWVALCLPLGQVGFLVMYRFLDAVILGALAYTALFYAIGALLPRPMVCAVLYAFLLEAMVSSSPGTIKRIAVSYYCRCMVYSTGEPWGLVIRNPVQFQPIEGSTAAWVLALASLIFLTLGAMLFHRRDFPQLG